MAAAILGDSLLYAVLPVVWGDLGLTVGLVGVLLSANRFVRLLSNPVAGWVVERAGVRGPFVVAVFVSALTTALYASGLGFAVLFIARCAWGVCWSFLRLGGYLAALDAANDGNRGYYLGFFNGVVRFGSFVAVLTGGLLTDVFGFEATVLLFAVLSLLGGFAVLRERPPPAVRNKAVVHPTGKRGDEPVARERAEVDRAARARLRVVYATVFLHGFAISGLATATLGLWLLRSYGEETTVFAVTVGVATLTGVLLSSRFLGDFLWGPVAGHLADHYGRVRVTLLAGTIQVAALVALALRFGLLWTSASAVILFLAATALQVSLDATAGGLAPPANRSRTMSWYATWLDLGAATGPLVGYLVGVGVGLDWMYVLAAGLLLAAGLVYVRVFLFGTRRRLVQPAASERA